MQYMWITDSFITKVEGVRSDLYNDTYNLSSENQV